MTGRLWSRRVRAFSVGEEAQALNDTGRARRGLLSSLLGRPLIQPPPADFGKIGVGICYDVRFPELAMIAARKGALAGPPSPSPVSSPRPTPPHLLAGCIAMVYPAAFNLTTGPLHWDLVQRARAVDNQVYVAMCSPARATEGDGYKAWGHSSLFDPMCVLFCLLRVPSATRAEN